MTLINKQIRPYLGLVCGVLLLIGWGLDRHGTNDRLQQLEGTTTSVCSKIKMIQDTLTTHNITEAERTERIWSLVNECLMSDNEPVRRMKN